MASYIVTFCKSVDTVLGGGIKLGHITEIIGAPGTGKTQLCHQIAIDCLVPDVFGGVGCGTCVYIDTKKVVTKTRMFEMCEACYTHFQRVAKAMRDSNLLSASEFMKPSNALQNILVTNIETLENLLSFVIGPLMNLAAHGVPQGGRIKCIIIDSLSSLTYQYEKQTTQSYNNPLLPPILHGLSVMAMKYQIAVVLTTTPLTRIVDTTPLLGPSDQSKETLSGMKMDNRKIGLLSPGIAVHEEWRMFVSETIVLKKAKIKGNRISCKVYDGHGGESPVLNIEVSKDGVRDAKVIGP